MPRSDAILDLSLPSRATTARHGGDGVGAKSVSVVNRVAATSNSHEGNASERGADTQQVAYMLVLSGATELVTSRHEKARRRYENSAGDEDTSSPNMWRIATCAIVPLSLIHI